MLDADMDAIEPEPELDHAREALFVLFRAMLDAGYEPEEAAVRLAWPAHELDVEFYWEAEGAH